MRLFTYPLALLASCYSLTASAVPMFGLPTQQPQANASNEVLSPAAFKAKMQQLNKQANENLDQAYKAQLPKMNNNPSYPANNLASPSIPASSGTPGNLPRQPATAPVATTPNYANPAPTKPTSPAEIYTGFGTYNNQPTTAPANSSSSTPSNSGGWNVSY